MRLFILRQGGLPFIYPGHEDPITDGQQGGAEKHTENAVRGHSAEGAQQHYRHWRVDSAPQQQRFEDVIGHAGDDQQDGVEDIHAGTVGAETPH